ncbi:hypothetical protein IscW_ISCW014031 [Ixodes scapularis]|uniref:Uncharacterized protein n=1 Tax=Ixodes scapularis TaxID=6945 RepID=B7QLD5_IXOSC|nr:hypothetical protein IscW_ISCW014031 [Ixodes scapularis]|eukprot:XP_002415990.1 hypothetical protein IscW_ISCW014031 [Ixodes scapularis]
MLRCNLTCSFCGRHPPPALPGLSSAGRKVLQSRPRLSHTARRLLPARLGVAAHKIALAQPRATE